MNESTMDESFTNLTNEEIDRLIEDIVAPNELSTCPKNQPVETKRNRSRCPKTKPIVMKHKLPQCPKNQPVETKRKRSRCPKTKPIVMKHKLPQCPKNQPVETKRKRSRCPKKARGSPPMFPYVLILLFNTKDPIIRWTHDGTGIIITSNKLPKVWNEHFKTIKIASFMKQLLLYGFKNIAGVYMHPVFNRDSKSVRSLITTFHNKKHMKTIK